MTYAKKIEKAEARVDWSASAEIVDRQIRALSPFPGAWCEYQGERIKLLTSSLSDQSGSAGHVCGVENGLTIACGQGAFACKNYNVQANPPKMLTHFCVV